MGITTMARLMFGIDLGGSENWKCGGKAGAEPATNYFTPHGGRKYPQTGDLDDFDLSIEGDGEWATVMQDRLVRHHGLLRPDETVEDSYVDEDDLRDRAGVWFETHGGEGFWQYALITHQFTTYLGDTTLVEPEGLVVPQKWRDDLAAAVEVLDVPVAPPGWMLGVYRV